MNTNHQMNYYDYAKTLSAEGNMTALIGGGAGPEPDTLDYVDLGLPSGTLWAKHNIQDADGNELYFAWGETSGYTEEQVGTDKYFIWEDYTDESDVTHHSDYKFGPVDWDDETNYGMTKYNSEGPTELEPEDDAATQLWGSDWRMPTKEQFDELLENTTSAWTQVDGANGTLFTSTANTNTLFFPAVGSAGYGKVSGVRGFGVYWSVSLRDEYVDSAYNFYFGDGQHEVYGGSRNYGYSVRPVRSQNL